MNNLFAVASLILALTSTSATCAPSHIRLGEDLPRFDRLKAGVHRYARYRVEGGKRTLIDIWSRRISFEAHEGRPAMHIVQQWDEVVTKPGGFRRLDQDSWFERATFRPLTHIRQETREGSVTLKGYRFLPDRVEGLTDLGGNAAAGFDMRFPEPAFNFEYDMEILQALPLAAGYVADVVFYDAGIDPKPDHYLFKVVGSEDIVGWDGRTASCWVVTADYNTGTEKSRFWFDKRSQVLIREAATLPAGGTLIKALLPPEPGD